MTLRTLLLLAGVFAAAPAGAQTATAPNAAPTAPTAEVTATPGLFERELGPPPADRAGWTGLQWLNDYYAQREDSPAAALVSLLRARTDGPHRQRVAGELAYIALARGEKTLAAQEFGVMASGDDPELATQARAELDVMVGQLLTEAAQARAGQAWDRALALCDAAETAGAAPGLVGMERVYAYIGAQRSDEARAVLAEVARGEDRELAKLAKKQLDVLPQQWLIDTNRHIEEGDLDAAYSAVTEALGQRTDPEQVVLVTGRVLRLMGRLTEAEKRLKTARRSANPEIAAQAEAELDQLGQGALAEARRHRAAQEYPEALDALVLAAEFGAPSDEVALERGYVLQANNRLELARRSFREAAESPEPPIREAARAQIKTLPSLFWGDVYFEGFGWIRLLPEVTDYKRDFVPMLRVRGYLHPIPGIDLDPYIFFQISRDTESRPTGPNGYPVILADNTLMFGGGVLFRFWEKRVGLFAQVGPAFHLVERQDRPRWELDVRAGAFVGVEGPKCRPEPALQKPGARALLDPCFDVYSEAIYVSRFDHNVFFSARGRASLNYLVTGPVAWAPVAEVRVFKDVKNEFYNNLIDGGVAHRWRLLVPFAMDALVGIHGGTYFGLENQAPAPPVLSYLDFRVQLAAYFAF